MNREPMAYGFAASFRVSNAHYGAVRAHFEKRAPRQAQVKPVFEKMRDKTKIWSMFPDSRFGEHALAKFVSPGCASRDIAVN